jgi:hypothetical protein
LGRVLKCGEEIELTGIPLSPHPSIPLSRLGLTRESGGDRAGERRKKVREKEREPWESQTGSRRISCEKKVCDI